MDLGVHLVNPLNQVRRLRVQQGPGGSLGSLIVLVPSGEPRDPDPVRRQRGGSRVKLPIARPAYDVEDSSFFAPP